jgi:hypothetical protein
MRESGAKSEEKEKDGVRRAECAERRPHPRYSTQDSTLVASTEEVLPPLENAGELAKRTKERGEGRKSEKARERESKRAREQERSPK